MNPSIRLATINDLPDLRALWGQMVLEIKPTYPTGLQDKVALDTFTRQCALALTGEDSTAAIFLADHDNHVVGMLILDIQTRALGEPARFAFVHWLYVVPTLRQTGIATELIDMGAEYLLAKGVRHVELTTQPGRDDFSALGFQPLELRSHALITDVISVTAQKRKAWSPDPTANGVDETVTESTTNTSDTNVEVEE